MEEENIKKMLQERFQMLPETIRDAILKSGWEQKVRNIVSRNNLRIGEGSIIERETLLVMLGLKHPNEYTKSLMEEAGISLELSQSITEEVDQEVFKPIKQYLINLNDTEDEAELKMGASKANIAGVDGSNPLEQQIDDISVTRESVINEAKEDIEILNEEEEEEMIRGVSFGEPKTVSAPVTPISTPSREDQQIGTLKVENLTVEKLNNTTKATKEDYTLSDLDEPKHTSTDPYREPIN